VSTWHLHAINGHSLVLASSAMVLLASTCLDRRLGQAAMCDTFAGMSGGRLAPNLSIAAPLGALTSLSYKVLVHVGDMSRGIGGRLGASAFLAASVTGRWDCVDNKEVEAQPDGEGRRCWRRRNEVTELFVIMCGY
jgi:hypothetical protein